MTILSQKPVKLVDDAYIVTELSNGNYVFTSDHSTKYLTTVTDCTCPGFQFRKRCRHLEYTQNWKN